MSHADMPHNRGGPLQNDTSLLRGTQEGTPISWVKLCASGSFSKLFILAKSFV